ncbi:MAG: NAD(P)-binding domain-containing protein, partial [Rubrivivax sp.]|nr:NAD(P)-binding domain-containing protein [Pyrinomonadaceae bacterium]
MSAPEQTIKTAKIGMIGLGVMGENLARNIERNGYSIAVWNREPQKVDEFTERLKGHQVIGTKSPEEFVKALERPRKMILLVKAGQPVDWTIDQVKPFMEEGDI